MYHKFGYEWTVLKSKSILRWYASRRSDLYCNGKNSWFTGCDGNPLILNGKITTPGVQLPIRKEVYQPILKELEEYGCFLKNSP
jgi:hypothetical protein